MSLMLSAEKACLNANGKPLTGDAVTDLPQGPILVSVSECFFGSSPYWMRFGSNPGNCELALNAAVTVDPSDPLKTFSSLTPTEQKVLDAVLQECLA